MKTIPLKVDILYYIEDSDLVINCPQLEIIGLVPTGKNPEEPSHDFVLKSFDDKLKSRISRFDSSSEYLQSLEKNGSLYTNSSGDLQARGLPYMEENYPYLTYTLSQGNIKILKHTIEIEYA